MESQPTSVSITVPFRNKMLIMKLPEAQRLLQDLQLRVDEVSKQQQVMRPPSASDDGFLDRDDFYAFLGQVYSDPTYLRSHAGRLFGRLTRLAQQREIALNVICIQCGRHVTEECAGSNYLHLLNNADLRIEVSSLKKCSQQFLEGNFRQTGKEIKEDFRVLLAHL